MNKAETIWPAAGSSATILAFAFLLDYATTSFTTGITEASHAIAQGFGFVAIIGPLVVLALLANHAAIAWRQRNIFPILGLLLGVPLAVPAVVISAVVGKTLAYPIRWMGCHDSRATLILAVLTSGFLAILGIKSIVALHRESKASQPTP